MANRKIVLTWGAGFLLSYVAETYAAMGDDVVMFERTKRSDLPKYAKKILEEYPTARYVEGEINELHVGLKSTMNPLFLKDLAIKTRRGQRGRVEAGKIPGCNSYGYKIVRRLRAADETGGRSVHGCALMNAVWVTFPSYQL